MFEKKFADYLTVVKAYVDEETAYNERTLKFHLQDQEDYKQDKEIQSKKVEFLYEIKEVAKQECIAMYLNDLTQYKDKKLEWFENIKDATIKDDLFMLDILWDSSFGLPLLSSEVDLFLLSYLSDYIIKPAIDGFNEWLAKNIFERILDTAEPDLEQYTEILDKIFYQKKTYSWYKDFSPQLQKLIGCAQISKATFLVIKKHFSLLMKIIEMQEYIQDYINYVYKKNGLVTDDLDWIG